MFVKLGCLSALLVVLATAAITAAPAVALPSHDFKAGLEYWENTYLITGESVGGTLTEFKFGSGGTMTCGVTKLEHTSTREEEHSVTVEPLYEKCVLSGVAATIDNPCAYRLYGQTDNSGHARVEIVCSKTMLITVNGCTVSIEGVPETEQGVHWEEVEGSKPKDIRAKVTSKGVAFNKVGLLCEMLVGGTGSDLSITGSYTLKAYKDEGGVEGSQIDFTTVETH
ncbi:MAG TPA: hypothetical protein VFI17_11060 [Solirubrobacterales bacterium]|nr:hypothetical protein [Solirubrobacterales bacterium]